MVSVVEFYSSGKEAIESLVDANRAVELRLENCCK